MKEKEEECLHICLKKVATISQLVGKVCYMDLKKGNSFTQSNAGGKVTTENR